MASSEPLKIGLILDDSLDKADGVQQYVLAIGEWLSAQGHEVHYLVGQTERTDKPNVHSLSRNLNVRFNHNRMSMPLPTSRRQLQQLLDREQFDVLHVQIPYSPWLAHRLIQAAGPKTVVFGTFHIVAHSNLVTVATRALALWTQASLARFDEIVSVSPAAQEYAAATFGIATDILPNVVDYERFHKAKPFKQYKNEDSLTVLFLGRLVARKGCMQLLKAVSLLKENKVSVPPFQVLVCGKGPLQPELQAFVAQHHLDEQVIFTGFVEEADKPAYYATADIAVFPSTGGESFGIVLIEAMASGRAAVLAGDNSGYRSVLSPHHELLFDPLDAEALASKLDEYLNHPMKRKAIATWGEEYARQFDTDKVGRHLVERYHKALLNRRRP